MDITYYELGHYNNGQLIAKTFNLGFVTKKEHYNQIHTWLNELTEKTGELCEEWIIADAEGVHEYFLDTWSISDEFFKINEFDTHLDYDALMAGVMAGIELEKIEDAYCGSFSSDEEFAWDLIENTGMFQNVPENIQNYFDIEKFARDLMFDYTEQDGHYFNANW